MTAILVLLFKLFLSPKLVEAARTQAEKGTAGHMEEHAAMDMSVHQGSIWQRMLLQKGLTAISHLFVMDWASLWVNIGVCFLIAGAMCAWVLPTYIQEGQVGYAWMSKPPERLSEHENKPMHHS